jgi:hypothetical protein
MAGSKTSDHFRNHAALIREIRINAAFDMMLPEKLNKEFGRQSSKWHIETDRALTLLELIRP